MRVPRARLRVTNCVQWVGEWFGGGGGGCACVWKKNLRLTPPRSALFGGACARVGTRAPEGGGGEKLRSAMHVCTPEDCPLVGEHVGQIFFARCTARGCLPTTSCSLWPPCVPLVCRCFARKEGISLKSQRALCAPQWLERCVWVARTCWCAVRAAAMHVWGGVGVFRRRAK